MSITDVISVIISLMFAYNGWHKGIMRILLGPLSMIVATVASYAYYNSTHNIVISLLIGLFGPVVLKLFLQFFLRMWNTNQDRNMPPFVLSRIAGALASLLWGGCIIVLTVVLIAVVPLPDSLASLKSIQTNVKDSFLYSHLPLAISKNLANAGQSQNALQLLNNEEFVETIKNSGEYKTLVDDPAIQDIVKDDATIKEIENKDLPKLLTNPKFLKLLQDPKLLQKMMDLQSKITTTSKPKP